MGRVLITSLVDVGNNDVGAFAGERQRGERDLAVEVSPRVGHVNQWTVRPSLQWTLDSITTAPAIVGNNRIDCDQQDR